VNGKLGDGVKRGGDIGHAGRSTFENGRRCVSRWKYFARNAQSEVNQDITRVLRFDDFNSAGGVLVK
jgi:hypothetical protein